MQSAACLAAVNAFAVRVPGGHAPQWVHDCNPNARRPVHQYDSLPLGGRSADRKFRTPWHADGRRRHGLHPLDAVPET